MSQNSALSLSHSLLFENSVESVEWSVLTLGVFCLPRFMWDKARKPYMPVVVQTVL